MSCRLLRSEFHESIYCRTPRHIYREVSSSTLHGSCYNCKLLVLQIVVHIQSQQNGFKALFESELFVDIHGVAAGVDPNPDAPRNKICRLCATEVLLFGLKEWWIRERRKGFVDERVSCRKDCLEGTACTKQKDPGETLHSFSSSKLIIFDILLQPTQRNVSDQCAALCYLS